MGTLDAKIRLDRLQRGTLTFKVSNLVFSIKKVGLPACAMELGFVIQLCSYLFEGGSPLSVCLDETNGLESLFGRRSKPSNRPCSWLVQFFEVYAFTHHI